MSSGLLDWLLRSSPAPPRPPPSLLAVHALHIHEMTRIPGLCCFLSHAVKMPCHFKICPLSRLLLQIYFCLPLVAVSPLSSLLYSSSFSTQPDLCNAISLLAIYGRGFHGNYGLHLSFTRPPSLIRSLSPFHFLPSPLMCVCHIITPILLFFTNTHLQQWCSHKERACVQYSMCICMYFCV